MSDTPLVTQAMLPIDVNDSRGPNLAELHKGITALVDTLDQLGKEDVCWINRSNLTSCENPGFEVRVKKPGPLTGEQIAEFTQDNHCFVLWDGRSGTCDWAKGVEDIIQWLNDVGITVVYKTSYVLIFGEPESPSNPSA